MNIEELQRIIDTLGNIARTENLVLEGQDLVIKPNDLIVANKVDGHHKSAVKVSVENDTFSGFVLTISTRNLDPKADKVDHVFRFGGMSGYQLLEYNGVARDETVTDYLIEFSDILQRGLATVDGRIKAIAVEEEAADERRRLQEEAADERRRLQRGQAILPNLALLQAFMVKRGATGKSFVQRPLVLRKNDSGDFYFFETDGVKREGKELYALVTREGDVNIRLCKVKYKSDLTLEFSQDYEKEINLSDSGDFPLLDEGELAFLEKAANDNFKAMQLGLAGHQEVAKAKRMEKLKVDQERQRKGLELQLKFQEFTNNLQTSCQEMLEIIRTKRGSRDFLEVVNTSESEEIKKEGYDAVLPRDGRELQLYRDKISGSVFYVTKDGGNDIFNFLSESPDGVKEILSFNLNNVSFLHTTVSSSVAGFTFKDYGRRYEQHHVAIAKSSLPAALPEGLPRPAGLMSRLLRRKKGRSLLNESREGVYDDSDVGGGAGAGAGAGDTGSGEESSIGSVFVSGYLNWSGFGSEFRSAKKADIGIDEYSFEDFQEEAPLLMMKQPIGEAYKDINYNKGEIGGERANHITYKITDNLRIARKDDNDIKLFLCKEEDGYMPEGGYECVVKYRADKPRFYLGKKELTKKVFTEMKQNSSFREIIKNIMEAINKAREEDGRHSLVPEHPVAGAGAPAAPDSSPALPFAGRPVAAAAAPAVVGSSGVEIFAAAAAPFSPAAVPSLPPVTLPKIGNRQPLAPISGTGSNPFAPAVPVPAPITSADGVYQEISGNRAPDNQGEPMRISFAPASEIRRAQRQPDLLSDDAAKDKKIKSAFSIVDVKGVALDNIVTKVDTIFKTINQSLLDAQNEVFVSDGYTDKSRLANPIFCMVMIAKHNDGISHLNNDQFLSQFNTILTSFGEEQLTENDDFLNKLRSVSVKFQEKMKNSGFYSGNERFNEEDAQAVKEYGLRTKRVSDDALIKICGQENFDKMGQALAAVKAITPPSRSVRPNPLSRGGTFPLAGHASGARGGDIDLL